MNLIKESFDNLPIAVCFFDSCGIVRLINKKMLAVSSVLVGSSVQTLFELQSALSSVPECVEVFDRESLVFRFPDGSFLRFSEKEITAENGERYTQITAADVSELIERQARLNEENERLAEANRRAKQLYDNMAEIVREEEILSMKMRIHDDIGHCILSARKELLQNNGIEAVKASAARWEESIDVLYHAAAGTQETDEIENAIRRASRLGVTVYINGQLSDCTERRKLFVLALNECVTNCVRHADGTEVYLSAFKKGNRDEIRITNNGIPPKDEISEGGGLSALRKRIEKHGGTMTVQSRPFFELCITFGEGENYD